jgi:hypothetical protein
MNRKVAAAVLFGLALAGARPARAEKAPHGGVLFATKDDKYHVELKLKEGLLYVLASNAKTPVPTAAKSFILTVKGDANVKVEFVPDPQKGDPKGRASRFKAAADKLPKGKLDFDKVQIDGAIKDKAHHFELDKD